MSPFDKIILNSLPVRAVIGTMPAERTAKQILLFHVELYGDFRNAGRTDNLSDTFDYTEAERRIVSFAENSSYHLLEALAEQTAALLLREFPLIQGVRLRIDKPAAPVLSNGVSLEIERIRQA